MINPEILIAHFNKIEAIFWFLTAIFLPFIVRSRSRKQRLCVIAASCGFILFGITDLLEAQTVGAIPAWLWIFKIACAVFLLACRIQYVGRRNFKLTDRWLLFGVFCLAIAILLIALG